MKAKHVIFYLLLAIISSSCIRDEAPNAEADILSCILPDVVMTTSPIINNNSVTLFVGPGTDVSALAPEFVLTQGQQSARKAGQYMILILLRNISSQPPMAFGERHIRCPSLIRSLPPIINSRILWAERSITSSWSVRVIK